MALAGLFQQPFVRNGDFGGERRVVVICDPQLMAVAHCEDRESGVDVDDVAQGVELTSLQDRLDAGLGLGQRRLVGNGIVSARGDGRLDGIQARRTWRAAASSTARIGSGGSFFIRSSAPEKSARTSRPMDAATDFLSAPFMPSQ